MQKEHINLARKRGPRGCGGIHAGGSSASRRVGLVTQGLLIPRLLPADHAVGGLLGVWRQWMTGRGNDSWKGVPADYTADSAKIKHEER